ncbi:MAG TPA: hypothetical protein DCG30_07555 [Ruminococcus sp.]|nr:hypothetical protein [Ruminococcus sp.]
MNEDKFTYTYSPARDSEVDKIAAKYMQSQKSDSDLERLRKLDRRAEFPGTAAGIATGLAGIIILIAGIMLIISFDYFAVGIIAGIVGFALAAAATPVSKAVTLRNRERYRDEILALSKKIKEK